MKVSTTGEALELLDGGTDAAAFGAAMEMGLFWLLDEAPMDAAGVAGTLGIPPLRCGYWLQVLARTGALDRDQTGRFRTSAAIRQAVLDVYSPATWALLAEEARDRLRAMCDLPKHLRRREAWPGGAHTISGAYDRMALDAAAARRFTRMLYEVHLPLAAALADFLELGTATRLMDLGGGSGVVAMQLARRHPSLSATVVDVANVCAAGEEIVAAEGMTERVSFHAADFQRDPLPAGFDVVLECDVDVYSEDLLGKVRASLEPAGRYLIVDQLSQAPGEAEPSRLHWAFAGSVVDPDHQPPALPWLRDLLGRCGFRVAAENRLDGHVSSLLSRNLTVIDARPA